MTEAVEVINVHKNEDVQAITDGLEALQCLAFQVADAKGFHDDMPQRRDFFSSDRGAKAYQQALNDRISRRLQLINDEVSEAHEAHRDGLGITQTYYLDKATGERYTSQGHDENGVPLRKPEGIPSELADVIIRVGDLAEEYGIDLGAIVLEKLAYNATRPAMHGRKF